MSEHLVDEVLAISKRDLQLLVDHALAGGDNEVCGLLAGAGGRVAGVFPVRNAAAEVSSEQPFFRDRATGAPVHGRTQVHYYMDEAELIRTWHRIEDDLGQEVIGFYHSHVASEPCPSPTDIRLAQDGGTMVYVLIGLSDRSTPSVRAWRILKSGHDDENGDLVELRIKSTIEIGAPDFGD